MVKAIFVAVLATLIAAKLEEIYKINRPTVLVSAPSARPASQQSGQQPAHNADPPVSAAPETTQPAFGIDEKASASSALQTSPTAQQHAATGSDVSDASNASSQVLPQLDASQPFSSEPQDAPAFSTPTSRGVPAQSFVNRAPSQGYIFTNQQRPQRPYSEFPPYQRRPPSFFGRIFNSRPVVPSPAWRPRPGVVAAPRR